MSEQDSPSTQEGTKMTDTQKLQKALDDARKEAARYRTERNEYKGQIEELSPLADKAKQLEAEQMTEIEKMTAALNAAQKALEMQEAENARIQRESQLRLLARDAGVDDDTLEFIDTSKIDLSDTEGATAVLQRFAPQKPPASNNVVNPAKSKGVMTKKEFSALSLDERIALLEKNPGITADLT